MPRPQLGNFGTLNYNALHECVWMHCLEQLEKTLTVDIMDESTDISDIINCSYEHAKGLSGLWQFHSRSLLPNKLVCQFNNLYRTWTVQSYSSFSQATLHFPLTRKFLFQKSASYLAWFVLIDWWLISIEQGHFSSGLFITSQARISCSQNVWNEVLCSLGHRQSKRGQLQLKTYRHGRGTLCKGTPASNWYQVQEAVGWGWVGQKFRGSN